MEGGGGEYTPGNLEESQSGCVLPSSLGANSLKKAVGVLYLLDCCGTLVAVYAVATPFLTPALRKICLPFVPATTKQIENVVKVCTAERGPCYVILIANYTSFTKHSPSQIHFARCCAIMMERDSGFSATSRQADQGLAH
uniref:ATP synthase c subunit lysine N-methyltransferase n=1 Tax=Ursus americanus TaxID=9643 RepID=A0A452SEZ0_URSAM